MFNLKSFSAIVAVTIAITFTGCIGPHLGQKTENKSTPPAFGNGLSDTLNSGQLSWKVVFTDTNLRSLIDTALGKNQELNVILQELQIAKNEVRSRKGAYLPMIGAGAGSGLEKVGRYTSQGANDANTEIMPGKSFPEPLPNYVFGANLNWEIDIWKKLRNSKNAAVHKYLSSIEGKNFMVTHLIAEIANAYYELMALDNQLDILRKNIQIQQNALEIVKLEKNAAKVTELAVRKFEAEVYKNQSRQFEIMQQITETENRINFLCGRLPQKVKRNSENFVKAVPPFIHEGIPSQLLVNRPDIRQAEQELMAAKLDVKAARAQFYPNFTIRAGIGYQAFNPGYLIQSPQSLVYNLAGELMAPLINRNAIRANYNSANARQIQSVFNYEKSILNAFVEVNNQLAKINNLKSSYELKEKQVEALTQSIDISTILFKSARADYMEVLMTQRDALESKFELIETKKQQMNAVVNVYQALGGGWK